MIGSSERRSQKAAEYRVPRAAQVLRKSSDFERVLRSGHRSTSANFVLRAVRNTEAHPRLGIIAGRKAAPRAVDRNRAKRLIREVFRKFASRLGTQDVAIQLRGDLRRHVNEAIREELHSVFESFVRRLEKTPDT